MNSDLNYGKQIWNYVDIRKDIDIFLELYEQRPVKDNQGGMLSPHLFWTWYVLKKLQPKNIIESGVWKGQGTWIMRKACPDAKIFSIDPNMSNRIYIDEKVTYFMDDFSRISWNSYLEPKETVCFFDDHQDAYMRLMQMKWMGFSEAIFEDNYPVTQGDCYSLKKVFSKKGFIHNGIVKIPPNEAHACYLKSNIETYTTLPPLFKDELTRWGDEWNEENYPTSEALLGVEDIEKYKLLKEEAKAYNWICYVKLI